MSLSIKFHYNDLAFEDKFLKSEFMLFRLTLTLSPEEEGMVLYPQALACALSILG